MGMPILRISPKSIPSHRRRIGMLMMRTSRFIILPQRSSISMVLLSAPRHLTHLLYLSSKGTRTSDGSISEWVLSHTSLAVGRSILSSRATVVIAKYAIDHAKDFFTRLDKELADSGEAPVDHNLYKGIEAFLNLSRWIGNGPMPKPMTSIKTIRMYLTSSPSSRGMMPKRMMT